jgi:hypothetical protein
MVRAHRPGLALSVVLAAAGCSTTINQNAPATTVGKPTAVAAPGAIDAIVAGRPDGTWRERLVGAEIVGTQLVISTTLSKGDVPRALLVCQYADPWWTQAPTPVASSRVLDADGNTLVRRRGPDQQCGTGNDLNG